MKQLIWLTFIVVLLLNNACSAEKKVTPESILEDYLQIRRSAKPIDSFHTIVAIATCTDPEGQIYATEVHSGAGEYCFFKQTFAYKDDFIALIQNDSIAHEVDSAFHIIDTLNSESIYAIKSHEFHKITFSPQAYFHNFQLAKDTFFNEKPCKVLSATDELGNPATLYFAQSDYLFQGWQILNPFNLQEAITIKHLKWRPTRYGLLVDQLSIQQGPRDIYYFDYEEVKINLAQ